MANDEHPAPLPEHPILRRHMERTDREAAEAARVIRTLPERLAAARAKRAARGKRQRGIERD